MTMERLTQTGNKPCSGEYITGITALWMNGLYNFQSIVYQLVTNIKDLDKVETPRFTLIYDPDYDKVHYIKLKKADTGELVFLPTPERAIVDYIRQDQIYEEALYYSIETYLDFDGTEEDLLEVARFYNLEKEVKKHIDLMPEWIDDFYANY